MHNNAKCGQALGIQHGNGEVPSVVWSGYVLTLRSCRHIQALPSGKFVVQCGECTKVSRSSS
jgi:hypothetical protein